MGRVLDLSDDECRRIVMHVRNMIPKMTPPQQVSFILAICLENARLVQEVNRHRKILGIAPMPHYIPGEQFPEMPD